MDEIISNGVRIFRPGEFKRFISQLKSDSKTQVYTALLTGMRYVELQRFQKHPEWFDKRGFIHLPKEAQKKHKRTQKERWVRLNQMGTIYVEYFLQMKKELPTRQTWGENMKRWALNAGISDKGLCAKTTRKTWESWLMFLYPEYQNQIVLSQGHTGQVSLAHYQMLPFIDEERRTMEEFTRGWIERRL